MDQRKGEHRLLAVLISVPHVAAELASEYWKLLRGFERSIAQLPQDAQPRFQAQARYAATRLDAILSLAGLRIVAFDGQPFDPKMPAIPINTDKVQGSEGVFVERTLEPAVIEGMTAVITGKVYLASPKHRSE